MRSVVLLCVLWCCWLWWECKAFANIDEVKQRLDDCSVILHEPRMGDAKMADFPDIEMELLVEGKYNITTSNCFAQPSPYVLKDFCVFECPLLFKRKGKFSGIDALHEYQRISKTMQKVAAIQPKVSYRIAHVVSSYAGSDHYSRFYDVYDSDRNLDVFDIKGDTHLLPAIAARYRYILVDFQHHTVCAHLLLQLLFFSRRAILVPAGNNDVVAHTEVYPFISMLSHNNVTTSTLMDIHRKEGRVRAQSLTAYRFAMNFLALKRRCSNLMNSFQRTETNDQLMIAGDAVQARSQSLNQPVYHGRGGRNRLVIRSALSSGQRESVPVDGLAVYVLVFSNTSDVGDPWMASYNHTLIMYSAGSATRPQAANDSLRVMPAAPGISTASAAVLQFIVDNYDQLPDVLVFSTTQSNSSQIVSALAHLQEVWSNSQGFASIGSYCHRYFHEVAQSVQSVFSDVLTPWIEFPLNRWYVPGHSFVVSRDAIQRRSRESFIILLRLLLSHSHSTNGTAGDDYVTDMDSLFERSWPAVFRSACVIGNHDDCALTKLQQCDPDYAHDVLNLVTSLP